jgi:hypothetical protein
LVSIAGELHLIPERLDRPGPSGTSEARQKLNRAANDSEGILGQAG